MSDLKTDRTIAPFEFVMMILCAVEARKEQTTTAQKSSIFCWNINPNVSLKGRSTGQHMHSFIDCADSMCRVFGFTEFAGMGWCPQSKGATGWLSNDCPGT